MNCPFCGGEAHLVNEHWVDPMVQCACSPYLMRVSELEAHIDEDTYEELPS